MILALKLIFTKILSFIAEHWRIILIVSICLYAYWQKSRHDEIVIEYATYKSNIAKQVELQKQKNELLRKQAEASLKDAELIYDNNLKAIKNEYLKKQKLDSITISDLRDQLRDQIRIDTSTVSNTPADTETNPEIWRDSYRTIVKQYETLKQGCAITTNDFNLLRDWADTACYQIGCE